MDARIGINGFGRMGRLGLRAGWHRPGLKIARVNEVACDAAGSAHLLKFDSVHGIWDLECEGDGTNIRVGDVAIPYSGHATISDGDWSDCDIVIDATGHHRQIEPLREYLAQGVRKVIVAAPVSGALNLVYGINHQRYDHARHDIVTAASCTTNCLAPLVKVMHERIGIVHGTITTIHDITNTQTVVDKGHKDLRRARASGQSLIPTSTGSARAIVDIFPELAGKLNGLAIRVPLLNASLTDFVFEASREVTPETVNAQFEAAAAGPLKGILDYETRPLVSVDFRTNPHSAIVDALSTMVVDGTQVKVLAWYDNEWGYVNRLMQIAEMVANGLAA